MTPRDMQVFCGKKQNKGNKNFPECELALVYRGRPPFPEDVGRLELVCRSGLTSLEDAELVAVF